MNPDKCAFCGVPEGTTLPDGSGKTTLVLVCETDEPYCGCVGGQTELERRTLARRRLTPSQGVE